MAVLNPPQKMMPAAKAPAMPATGIPHRKYRRQIGFFFSGSDWSYPGSVWLS